LRSTFKNLVVGAPEDSMADKPQGSKSALRKLRQTWLKNQIDFNLLLGVSFQSCTLLAARRIVKKKGYLYRNFSS
jgi:hypothetical protein